MKVGIINYGLGNVGSVYSAFKFYGYDVKLINECEELGGADVIVLTGVGNFGCAVSKLKDLKFWDKLNNEVITKKKPILGICLGMQLFADISYEGLKSRGLGWIKGKVVKISGEDLRIPHIGWNSLSGNSASVFKGMRYNSFYFMHSYHFIPEDDKLILATTRYGSLNLVAALRKENIFGVQFHPEKSQGDGLRLLRNVMEEIS